MKLAIVGTGFIAQEMMQAIQEYGPEFEVVTIYNRTLEKAEQFAEKFGIEHISTSFEQVLEQNLDAVYLAVHSNDHYLMTRQALMSGKHVLCEKPAVLNDCEFEQLQTLAASKQLIWMDAMRFIHLPLWKALKQELALGTIGEVVYVEGSLGRISQRLYRHTLELAGGVLYDLAIYPLYALVDLLGQPVQMQIQALRLASGVEHTVSIQLGYEKALAHIHASCVSQTQTQLRIQGTKGTLIVPQEFTTSQYYLISSQIGDIKQKEVECQGSGMIYELRAFQAGMTQQHLSKDVYHVLTLLRKRLGIEYPSEHTSKGSE
ncbi:MAG: Gfo/Idh/MocA family protein [Culicoidibacterales bacterium]